MKNFKVVIGANFGDEGKGNMTNYFSSNSKDKTIVVRFNGGAQAGHTVVEGCTRHVFGHFGSGSLVGVPTFLTKDFMVNPLVYNNEKKELAYNATKVYADHDCLVTTYVDMLINQIIELQRGDKRHGSCGMGINETIVRSKNEDYCITLNDSIEGMRKKLDLIMSEYLPMRLKQLKVNTKDIPKELMQTLYSSKLKHDWLGWMNTMIMDIVVTTESVLMDYKNIVCEGAQGLMLDMDYKFFPHVTHSHTGIMNVAALLERLCSKHYFEYTIEVCYTTRCYMTRHGAGQFPTEVEGIPYSKIVDETNIPNDWQGTIRFGLLDLDDLKDRVFNDIRHLEVDNNCREYLHSVAVTCLDQTDNRIVKYIIGGKETSDSVDTFIKVIAEKMGVDNLYCGYGEKSTNITKRIFKESVDKAIAI